MVPLASSAVSPGQTTVTSPNLSTLVGDVNDDGQLDLDVLVHIDDGQGDSVSSVPSDGSEYDELTLVIKTPASATFVAGQPAGSFMITTAGGIGPSPPHLTEQGPLPDGLSFSDNGDGTARIAGTPAAGQAGTYDLTISASNGGVEPDATQAFTLTVQDVPSAPQGPSAAATGSDSTTVSWSPPASDGNSTILSYTVTASPGGNSTTVDGSTTAATIDNLNPGTEYSFSVEATNAFGPGPSAGSNSVLTTSTPIQNPESATSTSGTGTATTPLVTTSTGATMTATGDGQGTISTGTYSSDPVPQLGDGGTFFDVEEDSSSTFTSVSFEVCGLPPAGTIELDPSTQAWTPVSPVPTVSGGCDEVTVDPTGTSPVLSQLTGTVFGVVDPPPSRPPPCLRLMPEPT